MSVGARTLKWQILRAAAKGTQTVKIYSDPGSGLVTVDGVVVRSPGYNKRWADVHDGPGTGADTSGIVMLARIESSYWPFTGFWLQLHRSIMTFDLAVIPPGAPITKATFNFYPYQAYDYLNILPQWALVTSNPIAPNNLVPADYQNLGTVAISTVLDHADVHVNQFNILEILPAYLSLLVPGDILKIGIREMKYDAANVEPKWGWYLASGIDILTVDHADPAKRPYLEVTYDP
jgi:hypothetical protein